MIQVLMSNKLLYASLFFSFLFFIRKAVQYSLIGSYLPLIVVAVFLLPIIMSIKSSSKLFIRASRLWAILIIVWSILRIFISIMNNLTNTFDEYHLTHQFGIFGVVLSLIMLLLGIMIIKHTQTMDKISSREDLPPI